MTERPTLAVWLAGRTPAELATTLNRRPDASWGPPLRGLDDLASRLSQPGSVASAIADLPLAGFEVLHALAALGPRPCVARCAQVLDAGGRSAVDHERAVRAVLGMLEEAALVWPVPGDPDGLCLNPGVAAVIDHPMGLGRPLVAHLEHSPVQELRGILRTLGLPDASRRAEVLDRLVDLLTDPVAVADLLATAPPAALRTLVESATRSDDQPGYHPRSQQEREGETWARRRGLLFGGHYYTAEVPVEIRLAIGLAIGAADVTVRFHPEPPAVVTSPVPASELRNAAAAAAAEFTETVAGVLDSLGRSGVPGLKAGGVGAREVARLAKSMGTDELRVRLALELADDLELLASGDGMIGPAGATSPWRAAEPSVRFADLAVAWWGLPITASVSRDDDGKPIAALGRRFVDGTAARLRWNVVAAVASFADASNVPAAGSDAALTSPGVTAPEQLLGHLSWHSPHLMADEDPTVPAIWAEAHVVGVLAQGSLTAIGRTLLQGDPAALREVAADLLPPATTVGRFGSDLTVMVAGSPSAAVSGLLDSCADRESRGAAVVWRFSPSSVRRAFDDGTGAAELTGALRAIADAELPQPLTYLIGDVQRRHGSLTVQPVAAAVRSDDEALLTEVAADRSLRSLRPHRLAPTVIGFQSEAPVVLTALRAAGYLPVPADAAGLVELQRKPAGPVDDAEAERARPAFDSLDRLRDVPVRQPGGTAAVDPAVLELATALLSTSSEGHPATQDRAPTLVEETVDAFGMRLAPVERRQLAYAIENQLPIRITYQSASGGTTSRMISDIELVNGLMYAWCHLRADERVFSIDRVQAVSPVLA